MGIKIIKGGEQSELSDRVAEVVNGYRDGLNRITGYEISRHINDVPIITVTMMLTTDEDALLSFKAEVTSLDATGREWVPGPYTAHYTQNEE